VTRSTENPGTLHNVQLACYLVELTTPYRHLPPNTAHEITLYGGHIDLA